MNKICDRTCNCSCSPISEVSIEQTQTDTQKAWKDCGILRKLWRCHYLISVPFDFVDLYQCCGFKLPDAFRIAWYVFQGRAGIIPRDAKFVQMEKDLLNESVPPAH